MYKHVSVVLMAGLFAVGVGIIAFTVETEQPLLDEPKQSSGSEVQRLYVDVPHINEFESYYGSDGDAWRDVNPFVPYAYRFETPVPDREQPLVEDHQEVKEREGQGRKAGGLPLVDDLPKIPRLQPAVYKQPNIVGVLHAGGRTQLRVQFEQNAAVVPMRVGDQADGWFLKEIRGGIACFEDRGQSEYHIGLNVTGFTTMRQDALD